MDALDRFFHWIHGRGNHYIGYALVITDNAKTSQLVSNMLVTVDLRPCCFPNLFAVQEILRRAISFRLLIIDPQVVNPDQIKLSCKARVNHLVPIILLSTPKECVWLRDIQIDERYIYYVPQPLDERQLRETLLVARMQTAVP